jgi:hypothetical protein
VASKKKGSGKRGGTEWNDGVGAMSDRIMDKMGRSPSAV